MSGSYRVTKPLATCSMTSKLFRFHSNKHDRTINLTVDPGLNAVYPPQVIGPREDGSRVGGGSVTGRPGLGCGVMP